MRPTFVRDYLDASSFLNWQRMKLLGMDSFIRGIDLDSDVAIAQFRERVKVWERDDTRRRRYVAMKETQRCSYFEKLIYKIRKLIGIGSFLLTLANRNLPSQLIVGGSL